MKLFTLIAVALVSISALANTPAQVNKAVASRMDAILSDTVNEGEGSAYVQNLRCQVAPKKDNARVSVAKCDINFKVSYGDAKCVTSCFMIYTYENNDLRTLRANDRLEGECIEYLSGTYCD
ncbi:hypothetical protein [Peredibacter starrii]|uniref:Uncharacterized protein n=1 Tax=Peredibacter starrii TaxID=28202 RepID=A0AAX4HPT7_9BACT|nr:hypothetical protein [Peredibacter starrii]WPU65145.1 hypothetical protein SOO65_00080 [Peredibacter starrii]